MSRPLFRVDSSDSLLDLAYGKTSHRRPSFACCPALDYQRPQRTIVPMPVFSHESPLFGFHGPKDSASGPTDPDIQGASRAELERRSARPYSTRVTDPEDFAHVYESTIVPAVIDILQDKCDCDFSIDVHNFPELSSESVPRVIYITLPIPASAELQDLVKTELAQRIPPHFHRTWLKFRQGLVRKTTWWGADNKHPDPVCVAKNGAFHPIPAIGMSIGPNFPGSEDAGSLGGFVKLGDDLYGVSCRHIFENAWIASEREVVHPAKGDQRKRGADTHCQESPMGSLQYVSKKDPKTKKDATRMSLTFEGSGVSESRNRVAMDWCVFGPVPEGKNFLTLPSFNMKRFVTVEKSAMVEGNTEVYALARTSGYSLGHTSDVPGVQRLEGELRREWTVRQYSPNKWDPSTHLEPQWQCVKDWVTSGIGVPGDSGARLMRRDNNAVIGLIWARNHNHGDPVERVRLTYITPIVDILADIKETIKREVTLPLYSEAEVRYEPMTCEVAGTVGVGYPDEPWNHLSLQDLHPRRSGENPATGSGCLDGDPLSSIHHLLRFPGSTTGQEGGQGHDDVSFSSDSSTSMQICADRSTSAASASPSLAAAASLFQERIFFEIGAEAIFPHDQADLALPDLEADLSANSSVSSETLDDPYSSMPNAPVMIAEQDGMDDDPHVVEGEGPIRAKAIFDHVGVQPNPLRHCMLMA